MKHIGFTGTRKGMTREQHCASFVLIAGLATEQRGPVAAHHGDCIGADEQFHYMTATRGFYMVGHPSTHNLRAYCKFDKELERKAPLVRNQDIVEASDAMIATPAEATEQERGGTWSTIRMARRAGKPLAIVWPDGRVTYERWPS